MKAALTLSARQNATAGKRKESLARAHSEPVFFPHVSSQQQRVFCFLSIFFSAYLSTQNYYYSFLKFFVNFRLARPHHSKVKQNRRSCSWWTIFISLHRVINTYTYLPFNQTTLTSLYVISIFVVSAYTYGALRVY